MSEFVTLTCPTCGGKLEITKDIERFACGHCGNEHLVKRSGGIVALAPVIHELRDVKKGVDKTAAELAIKRLTQEIAELEKEYVVLHDRKSEIKSGFLGVVGLRNNDVKRIEAQMEEIMRAARKKNAELKQHKRIVEL